MDELRKSVDQLSQLAHQNAEKISQMADNQMRLQQQVADNQNWVQQQVSQLVAAISHQSTMNSAEVDRKGSLEAEVVSNPAEFERRSTAETEVERRSSFETGNNQSSRNLKCDLKLEFSKSEVSSTIAPEMFDGSPKKGKLEFVIESELKDKIGEKHDKPVYEVVGEIYEVHDIGHEVALDAVSRLVGTGEEVVDGYDLYGASDRLLSQIILKTGVVVNHHTTELGEVASTTGPWIKLVWLELHNIEETNISEMNILIFDPGGADSIPNLHSIIAASDGAMVARGNPGAELPVEEVPLLQEEIIMMCCSMGKAVIVVTNTLENMIVHPTPTQAEVSHIAIAGFLVITPANLQQILEDGDDLKLRSAAYVSYELNIHLNFKDWFNEALFPISKILNLVDAQIGASVLDFRTSHNVVKIFDPGGSMAHLFYVLHVHQEEDGSCSNLRTSLLRRGLCYSINFINTITCVYDHTAARLHSISFGCCCDRLLVALHCCTIILCIAVLGCGLVYELDRARFIIVEVVYN